MLKKVGVFLYANRIITYHQICMHDYEYESNRSTPQKHTEYQVSRDCHTLAYNEVCTYVSVNVINLKKCAKLSLLRTIYINRLTDE